MTGPGDAAWALELLGLAALVNAVLDYFDAVFRGFERLGDEARLNVARAAFTLAAGVVALRLRPDAGRPGGGAAGGRHRDGALRAVAAAAAVRPGVHPSASVPGLGGEVITEAFPLWLATLLSLLYFKGDIVILKVFSTDAEIGAYSAAYKVFEGLMIVPAVVLAATFTPLARAKADPERQRRWERGLVALLLGAGRAGRRRRLPAEPAHRRRWSTAAASRGPSRRCACWPAPSRSCS